MDNLTNRDVLLPAHGRIGCSRCYPGDVVFNVTQRAEGDWRITANPLAWGNSNPEILVLGFSKGPKAIQALRTKTHNDVAYAGQRKRVKKILQHIGVVNSRDNIDNLIADAAGRFGWGSLIRCTVEQRQNNVWKGSGGGMLDRFVTTKIGADIASKCATRHLSDLPPRTRLVVLFGLGVKNGYVAAARNLIASIRPGDWRSVNDVAYTDGKVTFVHVEHFASQGRLVEDWCGEPDPKKSGQVSDRSILGRKAREACQSALAQAV